MKFPFPTVPELMAIAIAFRNRDMIADSVLPRVAVGKKEFRYFEYDPAQTFTIPNTRVGRTSRPNIVEFDATEKTDATDDYALDDPVPQDDIDNAPSNHDPLAQAVEGLTNIIELDRELRTSNLVFSAATYPAGNKVTLSGASQFNDKVASTPLDLIGDALNVPLMRPNIMVFGETTWTVFRRHPQIVGALNPSGSDKGMVSRQAVAELFEVEEVLVGRARVNTAKPGQAAVYADSWGKHLALLHRDRNATNRRGATFGFTAQFGSRIAGSIEDKDIGMKGGQRVRTGESVKEKVSAASLGYFFENAVA